MPSQFTAHEQNDLWAFDRATAKRARIPEIAQHCRQDGQIVGRLLYERLTAKPDKLYGRDIGSSYQRQRLALAKQFKR